MTEPTAAEPTSAELMQAISDLRHDMAERDAASQLRQQAMAADIADLAAALKAATTAIASGQATLTTRLDAARTTLEAVSETAGLRHDIGIAAIEELRGVTERLSNRIPQRVADAMLQRGKTR